MSNKKKRSYEIRIYPNAEQRLLIDKTIGCCRFVYNHTLAESKKAYEDTKHFTNPIARVNRLVSLKNEFPWLKEVESTALQQAVRDFNKSMDNHFKNPKHFGFPKFKSKDKEKINDAVDEIHSCEHDNGEMFDKGMMSALGIFMKHIEEI